MMLRSRTWIVAVVLSACSASLDMSLEHKRCTSAGLCLAGYTCSETGFCERSRGTHTGPAMPVVGADLDSGMRESDIDASFEVPPLAAEPTVAPAPPNEADSAAAQNPPSQSPPSQSPLTDAAAPSVAAMGMCGAGKTRCGSTCVDLESDEVNCGACNHACTSLGGGSVHCVQASCVVTCVGRLIACDDQCLDVESDSANCGGCKKTCNKKEICSTGKCTKSDAKSGSD